MSGNLEALAERFASVFACYFDSGCCWQVKIDTSRRVEDDCRWGGLGDTLTEAIREAIADVEKTKSAV